MESWKLLVVMTKSGNMDKGLKTEITLNLIVKNDSMLIIFEAY